MKNMIIKNLIVIGTFALLFFISNSAQAYCVRYAFSNETSGDCVDESAYLQDYYYNQYGYNNPNNYRINNYSNNNYSNGYNNGQSGTPIVNNYYYSTSAPKTTSSASKTSTSTVTTRNTSTDNDVAYNNGYNNSGYSNNGYNNSLGASAYNGYNNNNQSNGNGITALSLRGSGGFMPSSIWQWILTVVLILGIIIVFRMIVNSRKAAHEVHTVHAH